MVNRFDSKPLRALVVDDDPSLCELMTSALNREGFHCDSATDGATARRRVCEAEFPYQLVVSDLAMPGGHGHALAVDLLTLSERPLVAVLTGVKEPRIAKDLLARGVDEIAFKPVPFPAFAAKLRSLVDRRRPPTNAAPNTPLRIAPEDFEKRLNDLAHVSPISRCAVELFKFASDKHADLEQVTATVQCDPALVIEVLRLANSTFFNPTSNPISDVGRAVVRIGLKRVGELALSTAVGDVFRQERTPFLPPERVRRRCLASGICLELLTEQAGETRNTGGLFSAAVLLPMGRLLLASVFSDVYPTLLERCRRSRRSLAELESEVFPQSVDESFAMRLAQWGIPTEIHQLLRLAAQPFGSWETASPPLRRQIEVVKTAAFLGELAVGEFAPWDLIDLPNAQTWKRLQVRSPGDVLRQCRDDLSRLATFGGRADDAPAMRRGSTPDASRSLPYLRMYEGDAADCLPPLLAAGKIRTEKFAADVADVQDLLLVNALDVSATEIATRLRSAAPRRTIILTNRDQAKRAAHYGRVIALPASFAALCDASASDELPQTNAR